MINKTFAYILGTNVSALARKGKSLQTTASVQKSAQRDLDCGKGNREGYAYVFKKDRPRQVLHGNSAWHTRMKGLFHCN